MSPCTSSRVNTHYEWIASWDKLQFRTTNSRISDTTLATHCCGQRATHSAMAHPSKTDWFQLSGITHHHKTNRFCAGTIPYCVTYTWGVAIILSGKDMRTCHMHWQQAKYQLWIVSWDGCQFGTASPRISQTLLTNHPTMSCLQAIEGEDTENPFICHTMNLLWLLCDKGTHVRFCWIPSHCGIEGNEKVDQLAKETLDQDIAPLASVHYTDLKPLVNSYIYQLVQTKWDVAVHGRDLYLVKPTLGPPKEFQHLTRAEEIVITRLRIGHTNATKSHILYRGPPTAYHHYGQTLSIDHMLLECAVLQECRDEYYTVNSLNTLFAKIPETCIVKFLREEGFFYLIWCNLLTSTGPQTWTI